MVWSCCAKNSRSTRQLRHRVPQATFRRRQRFAELDHRLYVGVVGNVATNSRTGIGPHAMKASVD